MAKLVPISPSTLKDHYWKPEANLGFSRKWSSVPIVAAEIEHAMPVLPIAFRQFNAPNTDTAPVFELVGVLSPLPGRNLFIKMDNTWLAGYIPSLIRMYPFRPAVNPANGETILCLDSAALYETEEPGTQRLFDTEGKAVKALQRVAAISAEFTKAQQSTARAVALLHENGLIIPWELTIKQADGSSRVNREFCHIDADALNNLDAEALHTLNSAGALQIAYAQLLSEQRAMHFNQLIEMQDKAIAATQAEPTAESVEAMFGNQDDTIKFSF